MSSDIEKNKMSSDIMDPEILKQLLDPSAGISMKRIKLMTKIASLGDQAIRKIVLDKDGKTKNLDSRELATVCSIHRDRADFIDNIFRTSECDTEHFVKILTDRLGFINLKIELKF